MPCDIIYLDKLQTIYSFSNSVNDWLIKDIAAIMINMVMSWLQRNIDRNIHDWLSGTRLHVIITRRHVLQFINK